MKRSGQGSRFTFWQRVVKTDTCWLWGGRTDKDGYGIFHSQSGKPAERAHRFAYRSEVGAIPRQALVLHHCDQPACVRPGHLRIGTPQENMDDKMARGRHVSGMSVHPECAARGTDVHSAKLNEQKVTDIRKSALSASRLAKEYGVSISTIKDIRARRTWGWLL